MAPLILSRGALYSAGWSASRSGHFITPRKSPPVLTSVRSWSGRFDEDKNLYRSPNIIRVMKLRRMRWAGHVVRMGGRRGAYWVSMGKPEGKKPLGRPRRRWEDNIKMGLQKVQ